LLPTATTTADGYFTTAAFSVLVMKVFFSLVFMLAELTADYYSFSFIAVYSYYLFNLSLAISSF